MNHAYTNGVDTIWGESAEEAVAAYCAEMGIPESVGSADYDPATFHRLDDDKTLTVREDGDGVTLTRTVREWIETRQTEPRPCRLICSTEW